MMGFGRTKSVCPVCLRVLEAQKTVGEHGIYLNKTCPEHGAFSALIWEGSIKEYFMWNGESSAIDPPVNGKEPQRGCPNDCGLCSAHLRKGCCMLLELTRRCNLECPVCYASAGKCGDDPNIEDIERQYDFLMAHGGPFNIQLSGGEPTLREDLPEFVPTYLSYKTHADADSLYNTPNCWAIYCCGKVFKYLLKNGGLEAMAKRNEEKAAILYDFLDGSKFFTGAVVKEDRSLMNVPFVSPSKEQDAEVVAATKAAGFDNLKGHKSVGGLRASIYNAMPKEGVEALVDFLKKYEEEHA